MIVIHVLCLYMYVSVRVCVCLYVQSVFLGIFIISSHASNTLSSVIYAYCRSLHILLCVHSTYVCTYMHAVLFM